MPDVPELYLLKWFINNPTSQGATLGFTIIFFYTIYRLFQPLIIAIIKRAKPKTGSRRADSHFITELEVDEKFKNQYEACLRKDSERMDRFFEIIKTHELSIQNIVDSAVSEMQKTAVENELKFELGNQRFGFIESKLEDNKKLLEEIKGKL